MCHKLGTITIACPPSLMVWVYDSTESLSVAMLIHASLTASLLTLNPLGILERILWSTPSRSPPFYVLQRSSLLTARRSRDDRLARGQREARSSNAKANSFMGVLPP